MRPLHILFRLGLWLPVELNWWIGVIFALGSALFALGSLLVLFPALVPGGLSSNPVFFAGSIPFTIAAYLQLFQAANAPDPATLEKPRRVALVGWKPREIGWLSCAALLLSGVVALPYRIGTGAPIRECWLVAGYIASRQPVAVLAVVAAAALAVWAAAHLSFALIILLVAPLAMTWAAAIEQATENSKNSLALKGTR